MAIRDLLWVCPICDAVGRIRTARSAEFCTSCGTRYRRGLGATITASRGGHADQTRPAAEWLARLPSVEERFPAHDDAPLGPERVVVRAVEAWITVRAGREVLGWAERFGPRRDGTLSLTPASLSISDASVESIPLEQLTAVQASSSTLQIASRGRPVLSLRFPDSSVLLWEALLQSRIRRRYRDLGRGEVSEFQPVIRVTSPRPLPGRPGGPLTRDGAVSSRDAPAVGGGLARPGRDRAEVANRLYRLCQWTVRTGWRLAGRLDVQGLDNIPALGPFLLVCNHQSDLDPLLIMSVIRRPVHTVAKSTLFSAPALKWLLPRICVFPVRRYQTDPQAVRVALRRLRQGFGVAIFVEGERSWDGRLQKPRPGTIRLALKAGVPIVPCAISGAYEASPRWHSAIRPGAVRVRFLTPILLEPAHRRVERDAWQPSAATLMLDALASALDDERRQTPPQGRAD
ncbi:MAG: 1-acyl-sn-glycerol-3-phosphate acyltransferase [Gemmatimonadetes bacterium]|nr:1-acyl-sn-glycerol-3-phosphate acyltransferase [Gemmatimonadota bacterium]